MLRFRLRPAHGWSDFATELVIVVLGVLIALGAQQLVDAWHTRGDVADFREALNAEMASNLYAYQGRIEQSPCVNSRLDQLEAWQRAWRGANGPPLSGTIARPLAFSTKTSVWRSSASNIAAKMPLKERLSYAALYDAFEAYDGLRNREVATWQALFAYDGAAKLSPAEVNALGGLIQSARSTDRSMTSNWPGIQADAAKLGIRPVVDPNRGTPDAALCKPLTFRGLPA